MTPEQKAAFVIAQAACAMVEIESLKLRYTWEVSVGLSPTVTPKQFDDIQEKYLIGHNAVLEFFND